MDDEIKRYENGKVWIPKEMIEKAEGVGLLQYMKIVRPRDIMRSGSEFCLKQHDSLKMSESGKWYWFSRGIGGANALSYLLKAEDMDFQDAVLEVLSASPGGYVEITQVPDTRPKEFILPEKDSDFKVAREYLLSRGIDGEIIDFFYKRGDIYQVKRYKSVCFLGRDEKKIPRLANIRSTSGSFKGNSTGSDRRYGFSYHYSDKKGLHLTEAPIDSLSYMTMIKRMGYDFRHFNYMSLSGISAPKDLTNAKVPAALEMYLQDHPGINNIYLHFDNDEAGKGAAESLKEILPEREVFLQPPPEGFKDMNEFICSELFKALLLEFETDMVKE